MKILTMNKIFNLSIKIIVIILTVFIIVVLSVGLFHTIWGIKEFFLTKSVGQSFNVIVVNILTFLVIIELFRSFIVYFEMHRFRLSTMIDPAIVFVIRELIVKLYGEQNMIWETITAFGFLLLCLGIIRSLAIKYSPSDETGECKLPSQYL
ncbi:MAG: phosphate-starvation-inducible PsiE family protein [Deltaproteobacteria bacterium]|nr:phosphate-starvation-inducible PsiE family protein [Deltaproteobacteria bacterium]